MSTRRRLHYMRLMTLASMMSCSLGMAQQTSTPSEQSPSESLRDVVRDLQKQVSELQNAVAEMRAETERSRADSAELRLLLEKLRAAPAQAPEVSAEARTGETGMSSGVQAAPHGGQGAGDGRLAALEERYELLAGKVDDQYQTKVESASKYRLRLSGIVLLNLFNNKGTVDSIDVPTLAYAAIPGYSKGSVGATLRQSELGLEVFGPRVAGAKTWADLQMDFGGGFEPTENGVSAGLVRLRTGSIHLDWQNTSIVAGQDGLFFSPISPTSVASLRIPALSYAGNLWGWIPQIRVEHRIALGDESSLTFQGGILDPLSGETPLRWSYRVPGPGEASRRPAVGGRIAWTHSLFGQPMRVGMGGFYSRQSYGFERNLDAWAGMTDFEVPLSHRFSLTGKLYRGRGIGGLYGGLGRSVLFSGYSGDPGSSIRGLNSVGGWAQLKYQATSKLEFNTAFGLDNSYAADLTAFTNPQSYGDPTLARNLGTLTNVIYHPRSDLLFSAEYRHLKTYTIDYQSANADHINLTMGVLF